ncbi:AAA family ATPase [Kitasatospora sp. A2-31]|uniref:AAA family ATPase n=1 Tax=Kitasatospora sp. A2-31 TaxID=2916414 RepID=UPI001EEB312F|nr:AAA family ATPase [Kitasatospora sp. A2-31]MCG6497197.1 AAA family ATPase [Kitasatospora sp. A2-31]
MSDRLLFESLEGLRGTGKSTIAPMLAAAREAVLVPTVPLLYLPLRREIDMRGNVEARMCFYLSGLFTAVDEIQRYLSAGIPVVVESYFARCLANHRAFGARLGIALPPDLPEPVTYHLVCAEDERRRRLAERDKPASRWDVLGEEVSDRITDAYSRFPMHRVDTTGLGPEQVVQAILATDTQGAHRRADAESVGAHRHLLPPVPRRSEGTRLP